MIATLARILGMLSTALVVTTFAQSPAPMDRAAVLLRNGHVFTPSGWSTSVAYRDGKIIAVGSDAYVRSRVGAGTERSTSRDTRCSRDCTTCTCIR